MLAPWGCWLLGQLLWWPLRRWLLYWRLQTQVGALYARRHELQQRLRGSQNAYDSASLLNAIAELDVQIRELYKTYEASK